MVYGASVFCNYFISCCFVTILFVVFLFCFVVGDSFLIRSTKKFFCFGDLNALARVCLGARMCARVCVCVYACAREGCDIYATL